MLKLTVVCLAQLLQVAVLSLFLFALPETRLESVVVVVGATIWLYLCNIRNAQSLQVSGSTQERTQLLRTLLPALNRRLTSVDAEDDALQSKPTGFRTMVNRWETEANMSEDKKWAASEERLDGGASWTAHTLEKVQRVLASSRSRQKKLDRINALLDDEMQWVNPMGIPELVNVIEERWRDAIPTLQVRQSVTYIHYGFFVGQCGLVLLKAATLL